MCWFHILCTVYPHNPYLLFEIFCQARVDGWSSYCHDRKALLNPLQPSCYHKYRWEVTMCQLFLASGLLCL